MSLVTAKLYTESVCPCRTVSCIFFSKFHILIVLSPDPEIIYSLLLVTATLYTSDSCPCKTVTWLLSKKVQTLNELSPEPEII